jgi:sigma-B regulation protein RsbU (phosphoserine phosphatase)
MRRLSNLEKVFLTLLLCMGFSQTIQWLSGFSLPLQGWLTFLFVLFGLVLCFKYLLIFIRRTVWRLRNRLILTYVFIGVVPIALILAMVGIGMYVFMGQVVTYLMSREMNRRIEIVGDFAHGLAWNVADYSNPEEAQVAAEELLKQLQRRVPKLQAVLRLNGRVFSVPANAGVTDFPIWSRDGFLGLVSSGSEYALAAHIRLR